MDSRLIGLLGRVVKCTRPVSVVQGAVIRPAGEVYCFPEAGARGKVVGCIEEGEGEVSVFVRMEGEFDHYNVSLSRFSSHFESVPES